MSENGDKHPPDTVSFDPLIQTENIAFDQAELVVCRACGRRNPPNRASCLYCAGALDVDIDRIASSRPVLRKPEPWENGINLITRGADAVDVQAVSRFLSIEPDDCSAFFALDRELPIARLENEEQALIVQEGLKRLGLRCSLLSDIDLETDKPQVRLNGVEFRGPAVVLKDFNTQRTIELDGDDLALIVPGVLTASRIDVLEKKKRGGEAKLLNETTTASDESLLDLYSRRDRIGFRVQLTGFDYSCLGGEKSMLAAENLRRLTARLVEFSPGAKLVDDYNSVRYVLGRVWEVEARKDSKGLQRAGLGRTGFGSVDSTSNASQFLKYSRFQWHLL